MKYITITAPVKKSIQYIPLSFVSSIFADVDGVHMTLEGVKPPEEQIIRYGELKTNSWRLYRTLRKCNKRVSFSIF